MKYTISLQGIGKIERANLSVILRESQGVISVKEVADILNISRSQAGKKIANYAKKGWLTRINPGVYIPVPLESSTPDIVPEDYLMVAEKLFTPCYIAGWSAAEYWGLTEQIFKSVMVITQRQQKNYKPVIKGIEYLLHYAQPSTFFGLKMIWRNNVKVYVSDPARTIVDIMNNPLLAGGLRASVDILQNYLKSQEKSIVLLIEYLKIFNKGAVYKRLGFLIEKYFPEEIQLLNECKKKLTTGNAKLDVSLKCDRLVTKWRLWVPENWK